MCMLSATDILLHRTRELAIQIETECVKFGKASGIVSACVYGGMPKGPQIRSCMMGVHVLIATPGVLPAPERLVTSLCFHCHFVLLYWFYLPDRSGFFALFSTCARSSFVSFSSFPFVSALLHGSSVILTILHDF